MKNIRDRNVDRSKRIKLQHQIATTMEKVVDSKQFQTIINPLPWWKKLNPWR